MPQEITMKQIVEAHQQRRERLDALEEAHKEATAAIKREIALLEGAAHKLLQRDGNKSVRTDFGTAYRQSWSKAKVTDKEALWKWAVDNNRGDVFTNAVSKSVVEGEIERTKEESGDENATCPIPGVELETGWKCNIRKSS